MEAAAWQELVWTLRNRDLLDAAIDSHLNTNDDGFDEEALKRVGANVEQIRKGLTQAMADLYTAEDRTTHEGAVSAIRERLETAETERARLEGLRAEKERADDLRSQWINVAEGLATFEGADTPSPQEQADIYARLNVRFEITEPRQEKVDVEVFLPFSSWIQVAGVDLPSYIDVQKAPPSP